MDTIVAKTVAAEPTRAIHENLLLNQDGQVPRGQADWLANMPIGSQRNARRAWSDMSAPGDIEAYAGAFQKILSTVRELSELYPCFGIQPFSTAPTVQLPSATTP